MTTPHIKRQTDVVIVGSGPGGASVACHLARAGTKVLLLERGKDYRRKPSFGTYLGPLVYAAKHSMLFTKEGLNIIRPLMLGGATAMYCGCSARPPAWTKDTYHIDLDPYVDEISAELEIAPLPPHHRGVASTRLAEAAIALGYQWEPQPKFMRPARSAVCTTDSRHRTDRLSDLGYGLEPACVAETPVGVGWRPDWLRIGPCLGRSTASGSGALRSASLTFGESRV